MGLLYAGNNTLKSYTYLDASLKNMEGVLTKYLAKCSELDRINNATLLENIKATRKEKFEKLLLGTCFDFFVNSKIPQYAELKVLTKASSMIDSLYSREERSKLLETLIKANDNHSSIDMLKV